MQTITTIGLDIAKSVFQVHGVDAEGKVILRRQLKRRYVLAFFQKLPPCLIGIEACASSHHWSRELQALGHTVRLMPPAYVRPYVKRHKNDAVDAEAICEAVTRANMRFVATKTPEQQSCLTLHRTRHLFIRQQTSVINAIRAHLVGLLIALRSRPFVEARRWNNTAPAFCKRLGTSAFPRFEVKVVADGIAETTGLKVQWSGDPCFQLSCAIAGFLNVPIAPQNKSAIRSRSDIGSAMSVSLPVFGLNASRMSFTPTSVADRFAVSRTAIST